MSGAWILMVCAKLLTRFRQAFQLCYTGSGERGREGGKGLCMAGEDCRLLERTGSSKGGNTEGNLPGLKVVDCIQSLLDYTYEWVVG